MELSWPMKLRIAAAMGAGVILLGVLGWPLAAPADPLGVVSVLSGSISSTDAMGLLALAFLAGLAAYFLAWPYGREIGVLAAPAGLAVFALYAGSMTVVMQLNPTLAQRQAVFTTLKWEPIFWLAIVFAGYGGVLLGQRIRSKPELVGTSASVPFETSQAGGQKNSNSRANIYINAAITLIGTVLMAQFLIALLAHDVRTSDNKFLAQPAVGQIAFAVVVSFGLAAFVFKQILSVSHIWPAIASALITAFAIATYVRQGMLQYLVGHQSGAFFCHAVVSILPVQMVAFGTLGSIAGYWLAVRYDFRHAGRLKAEK